MTVYEKMLDFRALLEMSGIVWAYYKGDQEAIQKWWRTPQEYTDGKTPHELALEMHGSEMRELMNVLRNR